MQYLARNCRQFELASWLLIIVNAMVGCSSRFGDSVTERICRFSNILDGLYYYDENNGQLPDAIKCDDTGKPLYSWRVSVIPFIQATKDWLDVDAEWHAPSNRYFAESDSTMYCDHGVKDSIERTKGVVTAFVSVDTPIQARSMRLADVSKDTILIIEAKPNAVHWMAPGDTPLDTNHLNVPIQNKGIVVGFADGQIWHLSDSVPTEKLKIFARAVPVESRDREAMLGPFRMRSSQARAFERK